MYSKRRPLGRVSGATVLGRPLAHPLVDMMFRRAPWYCPLKYRSNGLGFLLRGVLIRVVVRIRDPTS